MYINLPVSGGGGGWTTTTLSYADFTPENDTEASYTLTDFIPAGYMPAFIIIRPKTLWVGSGITYVLSTLLNGGGTMIAGTTNMADAGYLNGSAADVSVGNKPLSWDTATTLTLFIACLEDEMIDNLTAGTLDIYLNLVEVPS
jgi:hypothetical protein